MAISWTDAEVEKLLSEVLDKDKIVLSCGEHLYVGSGTPPAPRGCKNCWMAYWMYVVASTPPHLRKERLEAAYRAVYDAVKLAERGQFDFEPLDRAIIETEKDAYPDAAMPNYKPETKPN